MDLQAELELMAESGQATMDTEDKLDDEGFEQFCKMHPDMTSEEAADRIREVRSDLSRTRITDEHWDEIKSTQMALGHTKESYEYSLQIRGHDNGRSRERPTPPDLKILLKLEGPLSTITKVREVAGLDHDPQTQSVTNESGGLTDFVIVDGRAKDTIIAKFGNSFKPTFIAFSGLSEAKKALSRSSTAPKLGISPSSGPATPQQDDIQCGTSSAALSQNPNDSRICSVSPQRHC